MILVDTTVWIDFFAGRNATHVLYLEKLILDRENICICPLILTEILQGIQNDHEFKATLNHFEAIICLPMERSAYLLAAQLYRNARKNGVSIRKTNDCLIAAVAIENSATLLHHDKDFDLLARYSDLKILKT